MARRLCLLPKSLSNQLMLLRNINDKKSADLLSLAGTFASMHHTLSDQLGAFRAVFCSFTSHICPR